jgi:hypothetical protein
MAAKQTPSSSQYVVKLPAPQRAAAEARLQTIGGLESLKGRPDLALLRLHAEAGDPRATWRKAREALGDVYLQPVLLDEQGAPQLPTGEVTVRFHDRPSDQELQGFAEAHGLRLHHRNEFAPQQAVFEVIDATRYLPDVVEDLSAARGTRLAWANTLAAFDRR